MLHTIQTRSYFYQMIAWEYDRQTAMDMDFSWAQSASKYDSYMQSLYQGVKLMFSNIKNLKQPF